MMKWMILILGIVSNASASILVKLAVTPPHKFPSLSDPSTALTNWPLWLGLILYGAAFLLYATTLKFLPLNIALPTLTSGAIATVILFSIFFFKESFQWTTGVGVLLIIVGVVFITARVS